MSSVKIVKVEDPILKGEVCNSILRSLPLWFGIESAIVDYVADIQPMETWVVYDETHAIGFASINRHFSSSAEVHVMGLREPYHRKGIGHQLLNVMERDLKNQGIRFLTVKTLSESRPSKEYDQTRSFYLKAGFTPLEEFKTLWGEHNPCLQLVKCLELT